MSSYTKAALKGCGSYTKAALKGCGSYTKAALEGYGSKKMLAARPPKGSAAAKAKMAYLRSLRGKKKVSGSGKLSRKKLLKMIGGSSLEFDPKIFSESIRIGLPRPAKRPASLDYTPENIAMVRQRLHDYIDQL